LLLKRTIDLVCAVLLTLCAAVIVLRVRASFDYDSFAWKRENVAAESVQSMTIGNGVGSIRLSYFERRLEPPAGPAPLDPWEFRFRKSRPSRNLRPYLYVGRTTFSRVSMPLPYGTVQQRDRVVELIMPHWVLAAALALPPALWWGPRWLRRLARRRKGLCLRCGYDVRASTEKCPECGTPVPPRAAPAGP
jgi:hypothetical protein